jgi:hypothetical protein
MIQAKFELLPVSYEQWIVIWLKHVVRAGFYPLTPTNTEKGLKKEKKTRILLKDEKT